MPAPALVRLLGAGVATSPSNDVVQLVAQLNALYGADVVVGAYDYRFNLSASGGFVDAWADARDTNGGPPLLAAASQRPAAGANGVTWDGFDDRLRTAAQGRLAELTDFLSMVVVGRLPALPGAGTRYLGAVTGGQVTRFFEVYNTTTALAVVANNVAPTANQAPQTVGTRVLHASRGRNAGNLYVSNQIGAGAAVVAGPAAAPAVAAGTINRVTLGANGFDSASGFAALTDIKAVLFLSQYTDAGAVLVNAWAQAVHGATL